MLLLWIGFRRGIVGGNVREGNQEYTNGPFSETNGLFTGLCVLRESEHRFFRWPSFYTVFLHLSSH